MKKNSNAIYLGYGLLIGMGLAALGGGVLSVVSALTKGEVARALVETEAPALPPEHSAPAPAPVFALTPTFTPTPTFVGWSPPPSQTPIPSPTLSPAEQKIASGEMVFVGPLSPEQQIRLYEESLRLIALTPGEAERIGEQVAGKGFGSPTLVCGPLSIYILQAAGLLKNDEIKPLNFWLLNPFVAKDRALIKRAFPPEKYESHNINISLREITFSTFPLYPGDFLYIRHGSGGNFDHMLVVTRVDSLGRAYSVTNYNTGQGFIINEVMLYDPNDRSAGIFMQWTARRRAIEGATGFGGFEFWRLRSNP